jgi:hypothetical protein
LEDVPVPTLHVTITVSVEQDIGEVVAVRVRVVMGRLAVQDPIMHLVVM